MKDGNEQEKANILRTYKLSYDELVVKVQENERYIDWMVANQGQVQMPAA